MYLPPYMVRILCWPQLDNSFGKEIMKNNLSKNFLYFDFYEVNIVWNPLEYWDFTFDKSFMENICFP